jgi:hypothetical protein
MMGNILFMMREGSWIEPVNKIIENKNYKKLSKISPRSGNLLQPNGNALGKLYNNIPRPERAG